MPLERLVSEKRYLYVLEQIVRSIKDDCYAVGDKLPPEREIAQATGVSRSSVREALAVLEMSGVIDVRVGDGIYVKSVSFRNLDPSPAVTSPFDVLELRMCLESKSARLAAGRRTEGLLTELVGLLDQMEEKAQLVDIEAYKMLDQQFHHTIAACTQNEAIQQHIVTLVDHLHQPIWVALLKVYLTDEALGGVSESLAEHRRIYDAIEKQLGQEAEDAMWEHLARVQDRLAGEK